MTRTTRGEGGGRRHGAGRWPWALLIALLGLGAAGCVKVKPVLLDRKTQLENQILGTFQQLEEGLILASSVRGRGEGAPAQQLSPLQREAAEALMTREFHRDEVQALKAKQVLGEGSNAMLVLIKPPAEGAAAAAARRLVERENAARQVIIRRVLQLTPGLKEGDLPLVRQMFYRLNVQTAGVGEMVQQPTGEWEAKAG